MNASASQRWFWVLLTGTVFVFLWLLHAVLLPFVLGMAIAYFLDPAVDWLERRGLSRAGGTVAVIVAFFALIVLVLVVIVPILQQQIAGLVSGLPSLIEHARTDLNRLMMRLQVEAGIPQSRVANLQEAAQGQASKALEWVAGLVGGIVQSGIALVNLLSLIFITPVVAFYLLRDWDRLVVRVDSWLPREHAATIRAQAREIDRALSGFARGQALMCVFLATYYAVGLTLVGIDFGLIIGLLTGLLSFIPFIGTLTGAVTSLILAAVQFDGFNGVIGVAAVFAVGQILEGYILQPWLVGDRVGLHPVWIIFALLAGGALFGFLGILLAVPVTAMIGVLARFALGRYLASALYAPSVAETAEMRQPHDEERVL